MASPVFILGGYQSDFAKPWSRSGQDISDLVREAVLGVLEASDLTPQDLQSIHVANAFAELQRGQAQMGAMPASVVPELIGLPSMRHEAACASGSIATLTAMSEIEAGRYDCVLVLGAEEERNTSGDIASANMNAAAWVGHEAMPGRYMWPRVFGELNIEYQKRYGLNPDVLHAVAENNFANARRNPRAQTRSWNFGANSFRDDADANPEIEPGVRRNQCAQITDGAAALVLASASYAQRYAQQRGLSIDQLPRILGWGHRSADLPFRAKLDRADPKGLMFPHVADAMNDTLRRAGIASANELQGIELHDCFAMTEILLLEHAGLAAPGQAQRLIESGDITINGRLPVNPSGGLIGGGHPVGATGVRMLVDAALQVSGTAGDYQVENAQRFGTLNIGGAFGTVCGFVVGCG